MWVGWRSRAYSTFVPTVARTCAHNEIAAALMRVLGPLPDQVFEELGAPVQRCYRSLRRFVRRYPTGRWTHMETALSYSGAMRRRYVEAADSLRRDGLSNWQDALVCAFLKAEKPRNPSKPAKPRLIFPRTPRFNLELASRLKPFEHWLWGRLTGRVFRIPTVGKIVAKGLNPVQRANLILRKFSNIEDCVCFEIDGAAFEAHVGPSHLRAEHSVYGSAFPNDKRLDWLLGNQLDLSVRLPCGARFSRKGGRASGDFNTGMGNTLVFLTSVVAAMKSLRVPFDLLVDGDNALLFLRARDVVMARDELPRNILRWTGIEITLERPARLPEEVRFGGSAPVNLGPGRGWTMVREWNRVLSGAFCSHRWLREPRFAREWCTGVARCELSLGRGVPILQAFSLAAMRSLGHTGRVREHPFAEYFQVGAWLATEEDVVPISDEARVSFSLAFGVEPQDQILIEEGFRDMHFSLEPDSYQRLAHVRTHSDYLDEEWLHRAWR